MTDVKLKRILKKIDLTMPTDCECEHCEHYDWKDGFYKAVEYLEWYYDQSNKQAALLERVIDLLGTSVMENGGFRPHLKNYLEVRSRGLK